MSSKPMRPSTAILGVMAYSRSSYPRAWLYRAADCESILRASRVSFDPKEEKARPVARLSVTSFWAVLERAGKVLADVATGVLLSKVPLLKRLSA